MDTGKRQAAPVDDLPARAAQTPADEFVRGIPASATSLRVAEVGAQKWSVPREDLCLPIMTIEQSAFESNIAVINDYAAEHGLYICAHGKTMMAPQLLVRVLAGRQTLGLCAATPQQAAVMAACGAANVFIANQVVGRANLEKLADLAIRYQDTRFLVLIDSIEGVELLAAHFRTAPLSVLVEVGVPQGRGGVRSLAAGQHLIAHTLELQRESHIRLSGVASYEGALPAGPNQAASIEALFTLTAEIYESALDMGMSRQPAPIVSAGGSSTFDLVTSHFARRNWSTPPQIWIRPGVAPTYDHVVYQERLADMDARGGFVLGGEVRSARATFRPALALWANVQSIPDGDVALIAAGIRDFPADAGYPTLLAHYRDGALLAEYAPGTHNLSRANDQHGYLPLTGGLGVRIGDVLKFGISHPCTAFDKWAVIYLVDDDSVVVDAVRTYF